MDGTSHQAALPLPEQTIMKSIDIFYQGELIREIAHLEADAEQTLGAVKARLVEKHGGDGCALLFLEDKEEPLDETLSVGAVAGLAGARIHFHRCRHVGVAVTFAGEVAARNFGPGATVAHVKHWAAQLKFGMTQEDASEHLLQISGTHERPAPGVHVGALASCPACRVTFDLVADQRVNGAAGSDSWV
jgi:hypothetical protein